MARSEALKNKNGVVFGRWRLVPCEGANKDNWELCELRESATTDGETVTRWMRCGRYYQHSTFGNALEYAADAEAKRGCADAERDIRAWLVEYERIAGGLRASLAGAPTETNRAD